MGNIQTSWRTQIITTPKERIKEQHQLLINNGFYQYLRKNLFRILFSLLVLVVLIKIINSLFNLNYIENILWDTGRISMMFASFFLSESFLLGLFPSTFYIVWTAQFNEFFWMIGLLGIISWIGGIISFLIGKWIVKRRFVHSGIKNKIYKNTHLVKKWGSWIILTSALLPLPFSPVSVASGIVNFNLKNFCYLGSARILRFYIYGYAIYYFI